MARSEDFPVEVVCASSPEKQILVTLRVTRGTTLRDAVALSGLVDDPDTCDVGVFGRKCANTYQLRPHDRIEIYRPLQVDPKEARRRRVARGQQRP